ncbi:Pimeloyl-ACP methyl ester carboxylesterase [Fervidobacterium changbaicum]|uniref:Alpha/beta hydrolase n=1 Tax=Fervidobacterium changbaicum TaxID=310769 RepID=A0ABX5QQ27_9BACT|nr:alpha/beta hydrolase [Fervidobacterium changbaicum]QAV32567.1 alpha/beta hydrolase [Fervidobacterium changbaicum]SDH66694.1 Pimeloyl-ACP methyl ester carboxylesterase [Fervidobacterium changbaicum]
MENNTFVSFLKVLLLGTIVFYISTHLSTSRIVEYVSQDAKKLTIDGIQVAYREYGKGNFETIVFLHGFAGSSYDWKVLIDVLSENYHCIAFDIPPFGLSEKKNDFDYSDESIVRLLIKSLDSLGIEQFTLVGHSMGGYLSLAIASIIPKRVERLILFDAAYDVNSEDLQNPGPPFKLKDEHLLKFYQIFLDVGLKTYPLFKFVYRNSLAEGEILNTEHFDYLFSQNYFLPAEILIKFTKDKAAQKPLKIDLEGITAKTLIIYGEKDQITPPSIGEYLSKSIKNSKFMLIPNEGHMPLSNRLVIELVRKFLIDILE